jgi:hypothetical protein
LALSTRVVLWRAFRAGVQVIDDVAVGDERDVKRACVVRSLEHRREGYGGPATSPQQPVVIFPG